jgi:predicted Fe-Mo cluster-binding NifX family protein
MTAAEAAEQSQDAYFTGHLAAIEFAIDICSEEGVKGIVITEPSQNIIDDLNDKGFRTLTMHGNTTILW